MNIFDQVVYQVFIRDFTKEGTFKAAETKLEYIKSLGVTIIQLMPFHPIGVKGRKGTYGSPYAIQDYEKVTPDYGTLGDLKDFVSKAHALGLKVVMDVVFNHTSRDSRLLEEHPEWFYHNSKGEFANKVGDWADVYDLDHYKYGLDEYLVSVLKNYVVNYGIDGFRFDVCSLIPLSFYKKLRNELDPINKDLIYIGEAIDSSFVLYTWKVGFNADTQQELMDAGFNILYPYDIWQWLKGYLENRDTDREKAMMNLSQYRALYNLSIASIGVNKGHLLTIENHDQRRIASYSKNIEATKSLLAYSFFGKGTGFLMFGEEVGNDKQLNFFEKEDVSLEIKDEDYFEFVKKNIALKRREKNKNIRTTEMLDEQGSLLALVNTYDEKDYEIGLFPLEGTKEIAILPDEYNGKYHDLLNDEEVEVSNGKIVVDKAMILSKSN